MSLTGPPDIPVGEEKSSVQLFPDEADKPGLNAYIEEWGADDTDREPPVQRIGGMPLVCVVAALVVATLAMSLGGMAVGSTQSLDATPGVPIVPRPTPSSAALLSHSYTQRSTHTASARPEAVTQSEGTLVTTYGGVWAPTYLAAAVHARVTYSSPQPAYTADVAGVSAAGPACAAAGCVRSRTVTWTAWNNVLLNSITRHLIVTDTNTAGEPVSAPVCTYYQEPNAPGTIDPVQMLTSRFHLQTHNATSAVYRYDKVVGDEGHTGTGTRRTAVLVTEVHGGPPSSVTLRVSSGPGTTVPRTDSSYKFDYGPPRDITDEEWALLSAHDKHDCSEVATFAPPVVCVDAWLALQYECP